MCVQLVVRKTWELRLITSVTTLSMIVALQTDRAFARVVAEMVAAPQRDAFVQLFCV